MGVYIVSSNIGPVEDPSTNSIGGGRRALKASRSFAGLSWISSPGLRGENEDAGWRGAASMIRAVSRWLRRKARVEKGRTSSLRALGRITDRGNRRERRGRVKFSEGLVKSDRKKIRSHDHLHDNKHLISSVKIRPRGKEREESMTSRYRGRGIEHIFEGGLVVRYSVVIRRFVGYLSKVSSKACTPMKLVKHSRDYSTRGVRRSTKLLNVHHAKE